MRNAKVLAAVYVGVLVVSAVAVNVAQPDGPAVLPDDLELAASLQSFDACDDALAYFTEAAAEQQAAQRSGGGERLVREEQGILDQATMDDSAREASAEAAPAAPPLPATAGDAAESDGGGAPAFSGTNVQEAGVDEPDLVKTDGQRIVTVAGPNLHVLDATADPLALAGSLALPGDYAQELLLDGDRALVFSQQWSEQAMGDAARTMPAGSPQSVLTLVDLAETATPRVASTLTLEGEYVSSRMVDGVARVVLRSYPAGPVLDQPVPLPEPLTDAPEPAPVEPAPDEPAPDEPAPDVPAPDLPASDVPAPGPAGTSSGAGVSGARGTASPAEATIADWVPHYRLESGGSATSDQLVPCERIHHPAEFAGLGMVSVVSVDLAGDLQPGDAASVVADAQTVYASPDTLYIAFTSWESAETTQIHAFDITDPAAAVYAASGSVPGRLLNQWALSEHDGHLRVATTEGSSPMGEIMVDPVPPGPDRPGAPPPPPNPSQSAVTVLARQGDELVGVGRVEGLGPTERIYSVRFMGDVGYVVTFRETDPLYTLDLSDHADPRVVGELKILGYSAYLHPLGDGLLLGVGQDATAEGQTVGTQLSLFDVSDLANPTRVHQATLEGGHSAVEYDHRAFLHWPATSTIVLPVEVYPTGRPLVTEADLFTGAVAYTVDRADGFAELGRVAHRTRPDEPWMGAIRRSLVVGDTLYTVSEAGVQAADLATLVEQAFVALPSR